MRKEKALKRQTSEEKNKGKVKDKAKCNFQLFPENKANITPPVANGNECHNLLPPKAKREKEKKQMVQRTENQ